MLLVRNAVLTIGFLCVISPPICYIFCNNLLSKNGAHVLICIPCLYVYHFLIYQASAIQRAVNACEDIPDGTFSMLHGTTPEICGDIVTRPHVKVLYRCKICVCYLPYEMH